MDCSPKSSSDGASSNGGLRTSLEYVSTKQTLGSLDRFLVLLGGLLVFYLLFLLAESSSVLTIANLLGPVLLGILSVSTSWRMIRRDTLVVWTPYFWFLSAITLFYSLGPLVYVLGSDDLLRYISNFPISVSDKDLLYTNLLNVVGIIAILSGVKIGSRIFPGNPVKLQHYGAEIPRLRVLAIALLVLGGILQFLVILPWEFGAFDFVLPGVILNLGKLFLFGLMVLSYVVAKGDRGKAILLYPLWGAQLFLALIHFSKTEVMLTMLLPVLGTYLATRNTRRLVTSFVVMGIIYVAIAQMIHYGRDQVIEISGNLSEATIGQRADILLKWDEARRDEVRSNRFGISGWETGWARLSYSNVQTYVMKQYDSGLSHNTLEMAAYVLIPRILWPEKPITTDLAVDFYERVVGFRGQTHLGLGLFGEGYWNAGWAGVIIIGMMTGVVFWLVGKHAHKWMARRQMEYMPSILIGINMGLLGTTSFFANAIIGAAGLIGVYALVVSRALRALTTKQKVNG